MKRLAILRHAKSSWDEPASDDFDRPLNARGRKAARALGRKLKDRKAHFDLCVASPAARVRETLDGLAETFGDFPFEVRFDERMYLATKDDLVALVRALPNTVEAPLLVGHNPGLERLITKLAREDRSGLRARVAEKYPTAALAVIALEVEHWAEAAQGSGQVVELTLPGQRD